MGVLLYLSSHLIIYNAYVSKKVDINFGHLIKISASNYLGMYLAECSLHTPQIKYLTTKTDYIHSIDIVSKSLVNLELERN